MDLNYLSEIINASPVTVISTLLAFIGIFYFLLKDRDLPPGPTGLPIVGYWPYLKDADCYLQLTEMKKKYGDVFSISVSGQLFIHLGSFKAIREAHQTKVDCFNARSTDYSVLTALFNESVITSNGEAWKIRRKFFIQSFREYGLTSVKDYMAGPIYDSVNATVDSFKAANGTPFNVIAVLNDRSAEIFRRMMFNDDEITDEELKGVLECYQHVLAIFSGKKLLLMGKFARYFIFPKVDGYQNALENHIKITDYLSKLIRRHEKSFNQDNIRDIIDSFIKERNERQKKGDPSAEYFSEESLIGNLIQFVGDGVLGVAIFLAYFMQCLLEYPEEQDKIYKELEDVIGLDKQITMEDRNKLPYTNAFMMEVMRTTNFLPIFTSLMCIKETTLNGYRIPKGSITLMNSWACQHDPDVYEDPDEFRPSRYITEPGKPKTEAPIIFGVGRRSCAGESFTMMQAFLFLTTIIRNFRLERPKGNTKKDFMDAVMEICAYPRK